MDTGGKTMMEIAQKLQERKNLEVPATMHNRLQGIISNKPFNTSSRADFISKAKQVGISITEPPTSPRGTVVDMSPLAFLLISLIL